MVALLHESLAAGALGFSSSLGEAHTDGDGAAGAVTRCRVRRVPRARRRGARPRGHDARVHPRDRRDPAGPHASSWPTCRSRPTARSTGTCSAACRRSRSTSSSSPRATSPPTKGATVVALTLPDLLRMRSGGILESLPGWSEVARAARRRPPARVARPRDARAAAGRVSTPPANAWPGARSMQWELVELPDGRERRRRSPPSAASIPSTCCSTSCSPTGCRSRPCSRRWCRRSACRDESWRVRGEVWRDDRVVLGGSDAGAHVDLMCHGNYPSVVLGRPRCANAGCSRLEDAVHLITDVPARLLGLRDRGRVAEGAHADLVVFDPDTHRQPARPRSATTCPAGRRAPLRRRASASST